ncbi:peptidoglycan D,D-transpeptidase FtsI family protein [Microbacterium halotolerans]|uniref:peptidoglycan D,D-transpeptidase FtsI family protein n=1 Tax=Microbacterium halotolerans TaxID=246613 RepID=UPI000E6AA494|nr:penicillin-binding transpeptidase domain-containing protein [Microbacterium halotolerans]
MTKELRRLTTIVILMFITLFVSTSVIQAVTSDSLAAHSENKRTLYDSFEVQRGSIIAGGEEIASSVPSDDLYAWQRRYEQSQMWSTATGYLNPVLRSATGLESAMTQELSGTGASAAFARLERVLTGQDPRGSSIKLSLDPAAQRAAYDAMTNAGYTGGVVAIEPDTGRVLAMVSTPGYDANQLAVHDDAATNEAYDALVEDPSRPLLNRAIGGDLNPPGSTFKLVIASAALASGDYTPDSKLPNPASYELPGTSTTISNASRGTCGPGDKVTIADALRLSCNIPMAELAAKLGDEAIREQAEKFGFNADFEIPLAVTPSVYSTEDLSPDRTAQTGYGQRDVSATPLQIAMVTAGIANEGKVMNPTLVDEVVGPDLSAQQTTQPTEFGEALAPDLAAEMVEMMTANVSSGVASNARIDGVDVGGKTGTAENGEGEPYSLWFTGFAPSDDPEVAVAVVVEDGGGQGQSGSGNAIAAPIAKQVMEAVLGR